MRRHVPAIAILVSIVLTAAGCGRDKEAVIARVNQRPITQRALWRALEMENNGDAARVTLDRLIVHELIRQEAKKRGIEVTREELQRRTEALKDYRLAQTGTDFDTWLQDTGQTEEDIASRVSLQMLTARMVLDDEDRKRYFEDNREKLAALPHNNESVIFRHIVVAAKEEAEAIRRELTAEASGEAPADFAEIAKARSLDPLTRPRGGMVGWMVKGKSDNPELEKVLFSLKAGEISQPIAVALPAPAETEAQPDKQAEESQEQLPQWWRLVKVEKYVPPHEITYEDNEDVIEDWMLSEPQVQPQLQEFWNGLRVRADIEILGPRYRALAEFYRLGREARERRLTAPTTPITVGPEGLEGLSAPPQGGEAAQPSGE